VTIPRLRCALAALLAVGCGPIVIAYPPPTPMMHGTEPLPAGVAEVGAGATSLTITSPEGIGWTPNFYGGTLLADLGLGLSEKLDLRLTGSSHLQGPTGGLEVGVRVLAGERWSLGFTTGLGGSLASGSFSETITAVDSAGNALHDDEGDPYQVVVTTEYAYLSAAPSLGFRGSYRPWPRLAFVGAGRVSYSVTWALEGIRTPMPRQLWMETWTGVVWGRPRGLVVGAGLHYIPWPIGKVGPNPMLTIAWRSDFARDG